MTYKHKLISDAIEARQQELDLYDVNIANYRHMIAAICDDDEAEMVEWREGLRQRLSAEQRERRKTEMVLRALEAQVSGA